MLKVLHKNKITNYIRHLDFKMESLKNQVELNLFNQEDNKIEWEFLVKILIVKIP